MIATSSSLAHKSSLVCAQRSTGFFFFSVALGFFEEISLALFANWIEVSDLKIKKDFDLRLFYFQFLIFHLPLVFWLILLILIVPPWESNFVFSWAFQRQVRFLKIFFWNSLKKWEKGSFSKTELTCSFNSDLGIGKSKKKD